METRMAARHGDGSGFDPNELTLRQLLRREDVLAMVGLSTSTLYRLMNEGAFPRPVAVAPRRVAWRREDVVEWIGSRPRAEKHPSPGRARD